MKVDVNDVVTRAASWRDRASKFNKEELLYKKYIQDLKNHPNDKLTFIELMDISLRPSSQRVVYNGLKHILLTNRVPHFIVGIDRWLVHMFMKFGHLAPMISVPLFIAAIRSKTKNLIINAKSKNIQKHTKARNSHNLITNVNLIGEASLGHSSSDSWMVEYIRLLKSPSVNYVSVKISTLYSQIQAISTDESVDCVVSKLQTLYRAAKENLYTDSNGFQHCKFVNLDMEEYKDLEITFKAFTKALESEEFYDYSGGIVLQAYLPDSYIYAEKLLAFAKERVNAGKKAPKVRIVKGANLEMESVDSASRNWALPIFSSKVEVDANYKKMLNLLISKENSGALIIGIASHNLLDISYAYELINANQAQGYTGFEMLEGMAPSVVRELSKDLGSILLYLPVVHSKDFVNAVAYLIRRLDENTGNDNFLNYLLSEDTYEDNDSWKHMVDIFNESIEIMDSIPDVPFRSAYDPNNTASDDAINGKFINEPEIDFSIEENRAWAEEIKVKWSNISTPIEICSVIGGEEIKSTSTYESLDPSTKTLVAINYNAPEDAVQKAVDIARADVDNWSATTIDERKEIFAKVAHNLKLKRGDLIGAAAATNGKLFTESDVEVAEAIDFVNYYIKSLADLTLDIHGFSVSEKGVGLVLPPWNFPIAIPCGGISAALAAGNRVILKPADSANLCSKLLVEAFWDAGISKNTLQLLIGDVGSNIPAKAAECKDLDFIIFTGSTKTGKTIIQNNPSTYISAETGGKNSMIVTQYADKDKAIKDIVYSAFGHAGQKCSAASLLILEKSVFHDKEFKQALVDAAQSLKLSSPWDFSSKIGPMNRAPSADLTHAINNMDKGESWALKPIVDKENSNFVSPGIKWNVQPGSFCHLTELFAPFLSVICAEDLEDAINISNQVDYGLTAGLHSLDNREQDIWMSKIEAGNLYVNRTTTGAIVLRQPFGGVKASALGASIKCGGPDYIVQFIHFDDSNVDDIKTNYQYSRIKPKLLNLLSYINNPEEKRELFSIAADYCAAYDNHFSQKIDYFKIIGQHNYCAYKSFESMAVHAGKNDSFVSVLARLIGCYVAGVKNVTFIYNNEAPQDLVDFVLQHKKLLHIKSIVLDNIENTIKILDNNTRIRYSEEIDRDISVYIAANSLYCPCYKTSKAGRVELIHYMQEQSISIEYHRYGHLGREQKAA